MQQGVARSSFLFSRISSSSRRKLLKAYKDLTAALEKQEKEAALTDARKTLSSMNGKVSRVEEDAHIAQEATE